MKSKMAQLMVALLILLLGQCTAAQNKTITLTMLPPDSTEVPNVNIKRMIATIAPAVTCLIAVGTGGAAAGAAGDLQIIGVSSLMPCVKGENIGASSAAKAVLPFSVFSGSSLGLLGGQYALLFGLFFVHGVLCIATKVWGSYESWSDASAAIYFPSASYSLWLLAWPGLSLEALKLFHVKDHSLPGIMVGVLTLALFIASVAAMFAFRTRTLATEATFHHYQYASRTFPSKCQLLLPIGHWEPLRIRQQFGSLINSCIPTQTISMFALPIRAFLVSLVGSFHSGNQSSCSAQLYAIAFITVSHPIILIIQRPFRFKAVLFPNVITSVLTSFTILLLAIVPLQVHTPMLVTITEFSLLGNSLFSGCLGLFEKIYFEPAENRLRGDHDDEKVSNVPLLKSEKPNFHLTADGKTRIRVKYNTLAQVFTQLDQLDSKRQQPDSDGQVAL